MFANNVLKWIQIDICQRKFYILILMKEEWKEGEYVKENSKSGNVSESIKT